MGSHLKVVPFSKKSDDETREMKEMLVKILDGGGVVCAMCVDTEEGPTLISNARAPVAATLFSFAHQVSMATLMDEITGEDES